MGHFFIYGSVVAILGNREPIEISPMDGDLDSRTHPSIPSDEWVSLVSLLNRCGEPGNGSL